MRKLLTACIDTLFPPSADALLLRKARDHHEGPLPYQPGSYKNILFLTSYRLPLVQAAIRENKFHHDRQASELLASLLRQWHSQSTRRIAFVPIPLGPKRQRERGHNQVVTVLEAAGLMDHTYSKILKRAVETLPQSHLDRAARTHNLDNAFVCSEDCTVLEKYDEVILLDDVVTTGTTLEAARIALAPHLPRQCRLRCLALAH